MQYNKKSAENYHGGYMKYEKPELIKIDMKVRENSVTLVCKSSIEGSGPNGEGMGACIDPNDDYNPCMFERS